MFKEITKVSNTNIIVKIVNNNHRKTLIHWLFEVTSDFNYSIRTYIHAVYIFDKYTTYRGEDLNNYQLIGLTALFIAAKIDEEYPKKIHYYTMVTEESVTKKDIVKREKDMVNVIGFTLNTIPVSLITEYEIQTMKREILGHSVDDDKVDISEYNIKMDYKKIDGIEDYKKIDGINKKVNNIKDDKKRIPLKEKINYNNNNKITTDTNHTINNDTITTNNNTINNTTTTIKEDRIYNKNNINNLILISICYLYEKEEYNRNINLLEEAKEITKDILKNKNIRDIEFYIENVKDKIYYNNDDRL
ncbi:G2/mitotic specific cyclin 1 [Spraguea lophii 42_110]|uniref:G2/mitotic specific cyclin 1 n=1 Tax=Spraguea lophii (strain 42_110) TaxID=1358809 RepID=S7WBH8_SPRLO|nr:G2/mitotic specific cyclin 1 [Spraguea lophii 42_110]